MNEFPSDLLRSSLKTRRLIRVCEYTRNFNNIGYVTNSIYKIDENSGVI